MDVINVDSHDANAVLSEDVRKKIEQNRLAALERRKKNRINAILGSLQDPAWRTALTPQFSKPYFQKLMDFLLEEITSATSEGSHVFPPEDKIFSAFNLCSLDSVKIVILGQDPYMFPKQAEGLSFSVAMGIKPPPSLVNIFEELAEDTDISPPFTIPAHGNLHTWARQGILLLNTILTVRENQPNSHAKQGWEEFTDAVLEAVLEQREGVIFMLWGKAARDKVNKLIKTKKLDPESKQFHLLEAPHPSPKAASNTNAKATFRGCRHFSKANAILQEAGSIPIDWSSLNYSINASGEKELITTNAVKEEETDPWVMENDPPLCPGHAQPAALRTVRKEGPNTGRRFYCCAQRDRESQCQMFKWLDQWKDEVQAKLDPSSVEVCPGHLKPAAVRTVRKEGPNKGKQFYVCSEPMGSQCDFFKWKTGGTDSPMRTPSSSRTGSPMVSPSASPMKRPAIFASTPTKRVYAEMKSDESASSQEEEKKGGDDESQPRSAKRRRIEVIV